VFSIESAGTGAVSVRNVTLVCAVSGAAQMRFREGFGVWTGWLPFASTHPWTLTDGDGQKVVQAVFADAGGNLLEVSSAILLDRVAPVTTVNTAGGYGPGSWAGKVSGTVTDATSGVTRVEVTILRQPTGKAAGEYWDGATWGASEQWLAATVLGGTWSVPLPEADLEAGGNARSYTVTARAQDQAGNVEAPAVTSVFLFDLNIPAGGFSVGSGNPLYLNTATVTLVCEVTALHPLEMRFRNEGEAFPGTWSAYALAASLTLPAGNGLKTVYGEFRDVVSGNTLATRDTVTLDTDAPVSTLATAGAFGPMTWPGSIVGTAFDVGPAGVERVELTMVRTDGLYWNGSGWQAGEVSLSVAVVGGSWTQAFPAAFLSDATSYFLSSRAVDRAKNLQTSPATAVVAYDSSTPGGAFTVGVGNPVATPTRDVALAIAVSGATEMSFRNLGGAWSAWEPLASTRPAWQLIGGDGAKQVSGRFRDAVGNVFETEDGIVYDSTAPGSAVAVARAYGPASWPGTISGTATDALSGVARVEVRVQRSSDGFFWSGATWGAAEAWLTASGGLAWQVALAGSQLLSGVTYSVGSRAVDVAGNVQAAAATGSLLYDAGLPVSVVTTPTLTGFQSWSGAVEGTAADALGDIQVVEVKVVRILGSGISTWDGAAWQPGLDAPWLVAQGTLAWRLPLALGSMSAGASYAVTSRATDSVGNVQAPPTSRTIAYDGTAPEPPALTGITVDSGAVADLITNDRTLVFTGLVEAGCAVEVRLDGASIGSVAGSAGSAWSLDHTATALAPGTHLVELAATDAAGNRGVWSAPRTLLIDTVAPVLTCGLAVGARVNGTEVVTFTTDGVGAVEASFDQSQWTAVQSGVSLLAAVAGFGGLPQGALTLHFRDSDVAANVGRAQVSLVKDTLAPTGYGLTINQARINAANRHALTFGLTGAEIGSTCLYSVAAAGSAVVSGSFAVLAATPTSAAIAVDVLEDGLLTVTVRLRDGVGNVGGEVSAQVGKDTLAPAGYSVRSEPAFVHAGNQTQFRFELAGAEVGAVCQYSVQSAGGGAPVSGSATVGAALSILGPLSVAALADATLTLSAYLTDSFGNSGPVVTHQVVKDTVPPVVPVVETWTQPVNQATASAFACAGQAEVGATVSYRIVSDAGPVAIEGSVVAGADGRFTVSAIAVASLGDGMLTLTVSGRDVAGNQSPDSAGRTALKDTVPPVAPLLATVTAPVNAGNAARCGFTGTGEAGMTIVYTLASVSPVMELGGTLPIDAGGGFSASAVNAVTLPDGTLLLRVLVRDTAGNVSPATSSAPITKDTAMPAIALASPLASVPVSGDEVIRFTASEPVAVQASVGGATWVDIVSGLTLVADLPLFSTLGDGSFTLTLRATDAVGNVTTIAYDLGKDATAPAGYAVVFETDFIDLSLTAEAAFVILGGELGSTFSYEVADAEGGDGIVTGGGLVTAAPQRVSGIPVASLAQGGLTLRLRLTDVAGNTGPSVSSETTLGTTEELALTYGWNAVGVTVAPLDSVAGILAEAAVRADGALVRGAFHGYRGGEPVVVIGDSVLQFGCAYRVFAARGGTLRIRGVAGVGVGALPAGWAYAAPGADLRIADLPAAWSAWADAEPGWGYRPLRSGALVLAGTPVWIHVVP
jgi:hypothetical protein